MIELNRQLTAKLPTIIANGGQADKSLAMYDTLEFKVVKDVSAILQKHRLLGHKIIHIDSNQLKEIEYAIVRYNDKVEVIGESEFEITNGTRLFALGGFKHINLTNTVLSRSLINLNETFANCEFMIDITFPNKWYGNNISYMKSTFRGCSKLEKLNNLKVFKESPLTTMSQTFAFCSHLTELDLNDINFSKVDTMVQFMLGCRRLKQLNINSMSLSSLKETYEMFADSGLEKADFSGMDLTSIWSFDHIFSGCENLKEVDFSNVKFDEYSTFDGIVDGCTNLTTIKMVDTPEGRKLAEESNLHRVGNKYDIGSRNIEIQWIKSDI